jgi:hypothetical protein
MSIYQAMKQSFNLAATGALFAVSPLLGLLLVALAVFGAFMQKKAAGATPDMPENQPGPGPHPLPPGTKAGLKAA